MEKSHFPGYSRCASCQDTIPEKDIRNHILNCRRKSSIEKKLCPICNKQFDKREFQQHIEICDDQPNVPPDSPSKKKCPICEKLVEDLSLHCQSCTDPSDNDNAGYETPRAQTPTQIENKQTTTQIKQQTKHCVLCSEDIDQSDYENHVASCSHDQSLMNTETINDDKKSYEKRNTTSQTNENLLGNSNISKIKQTKECPLCSTVINESEYEDHVSLCSFDDNFSNVSSHRSSSASNHNRNQFDGKSSSQVQRTNSKTKQTKLCVLCSQLIDEEEYGDHVASCSDDPKPLPTRSSTNVNTDKYNTPHYSSQISSSSVTSKKKAKKECALCFQLIDEQEYEEHVASCSDEQSDNGQSHIHTNNNKKLKQMNSRINCILCSKSIDENEYDDHITFCSSQTPSPSTLSRIQFDNNNHQRNSFDTHTTSDRSRKNDNKGATAASACASTNSKKDCILCFNPIDLSEYENHVLSCLAERENQPSNSTTRKDLKCLTCKRAINKEDGLYKEIACHSRHNHCLLCLQRSMKEFAQNRETPVCHKTLCDYELSRHDISLIPLERSLSDRLLKLVKGQQRPLCTKCRFYININDNENFDEHFESCDDLIPCEYCQLPYPFAQLENHAIQCRADKTSESEKLTNFILTRTKYPFTKEQIRFFIQQQNKNRRMNLDPFSIIDALAVYGPTFPLEMPTRECDVCMEARPYDDIYVFDCPDCHKLCYTCYYQSCQAKMNNGEILTCAICTHPLRDGELNQLRIPDEELRKMREYQMRKTFDVYSSRTRGILKCPKQNCIWIAEAADPNERFKVTCLICQHEFCSLCNQQYHYRSTCQQLPQITQRWFFWCETERARYLAMRAQQDAAFATQLNEYNRRNNENENRNRDLRRRYEELMNDEQYKVQNCRMCPSCNRVVQRLEGCDSMICGQDAHGGNVQSGCGNKFNWAQANPYKASATQKIKQTTIDLPKPESPVVHHDGVQCDQCKNAVNGIRFDCVHCPSLTYCEKCEQQATLIHSRQNQTDGQQQHVFKLIMKPEDEAYYV